MSMFCFQCQETVKNEGCTIKGVCGKSAYLSNIQDLLVFASKSLSDVLVALRNEGKEVSKELNHIVTNNLFTTITNANFDDKVILNQIKETLEIKEKERKSLADDSVLTDIGKYYENDDIKLLEKSKTIGVLRTKDENIRSLRELILYGLKGLAAYVKHANVLSKENNEIDIFIQETLVKIDDNNLDIDDLVNLTLETGSFGVQGMALLDEANTSKYGNPEITKVNIGVGLNPGILISGHDLRDMEMLLEQSQNSGVDVYTHSEMLPAHYYPAFKKYDNFIGNYGNAWWKQGEEFSSFNGPILMTTNCIVPVRDEYADRIYTTGAAGYPNAKHIEGEIGEWKDFSEIIEHAKRCKAPKEIESGTIVGGFAHNQVVELADEIVKAVNSGDITKFVVMAGCDGRQKSRNYYSDFAKELPKSAVILTAGCAKYRYNKLNLGDINGIPRVLDAGQCNDSYSLVQIAIKLAEIFNLDDVNDLPIIYNIAWYEQKAVIVLLALLSLGIKNIHLGPSLPAFLSPAVTDVLVENFGISPISNVEDDIEKFFPTQA